MELGEQAMENAPIPVCQNCSATFKPRHGKKFCSASCGHKFYNKTVLADSPALGAGRAIPTGTVGAIAELLVAADLMRLGFAVYRALSPSSKSDLLAEHEGQFYSIEVRTARKYRSEKVIWPQSKFRSEVWALIVHKPDGHEVHYVSENKAFMEKVNVES